MNNYTKEQTLINSIIGEGTRFKGDIDLNGLLRIDGDFDGSLRTSGRVLIGRSGRAMCRIEADTVVVGGILKGNIKASSKVVLLSSCVVLGNIISPKLIIDDGAVVNGQCTVSEDAGVLASAPSGSNSMFSPDWGGGRSKE